MYQKTVLANGLRLITSKMPHTRSVSVVFFVAAGPRYELDSEAGIAHFVEHLCFKGTYRRKTAKEISEAIESIGGLLNGGTDKELTSFWCRVPSKHFLLAVDVLVDLVRNPRFEENDIERERQVIIEEMNMSLDSPRQRVAMLIDELLWPGKPLGRDIAGSKETVSSLTRQQIREFHASHYLPNNIVVSIAGDIDEKQAHDAALQTLGDWQSGKVPAGFSSSGLDGEKRLSVEFRETEQLQLCLGVPGVSFFDPDRYAVDLLSIILGEGMSSRLFLKLREEKGLAYEIHSYADHFTDTGALIVHAGIDPTQGEAALKGILEELLGIGNSLSSEELDKAKEIAKGRLLLSLENSRSVAGWLGAQELLTNRILSVDDVIALVEAVTEADLKRVAHNLFDSRYFCLALVGPVREADSFAKLLGV
jgi:predicted Zn-dependent peptidase